MSEELDIIRLRAKRAGNKSVVTKLANEVQEIIQQNPDELDTKTRHRLQCIDVKLSQKETLLNELNEQIVALCDVEDIANEIEDAEELSMTIMETRANISTKTTPATKFAQSETTTPSSGQSGQQAIPSTSSGASPSSAQAENQDIPSPALDVSSAGSSQAVPPITPVVQNQRIVQAKLPKLTLPRFRGEITHWITFWDSYNSAVHNNPALSKVDKFPFGRSG